MLRTDALCESMPPRSTKERERSRQRVEEVGILVRELHVLPAAAWPTLVKLLVR
jgi:hypothetical protein